MGICAAEMREYVIRPTLKYLGVDSSVAEELLLGTAAQESGLGFHLKQTRQRALGVYQIDPMTHHCIWDKYLAFKPDLASKVRGLASQHEFLAHPHQELTTNLKYATAIAWLVYCRSNKPLPTAGDLDGLASFWYKNFHHRPTGSKEEFISHYRELISDKNVAA